jgi:predicted outer membrane repeat protein
MFGKKQKFVVLNLIVIMLLLGGLFGVTPARAGSDSIPEVKISTPSYPVGIKGGQSKLVVYSLMESGNVSGTITSRSYRFYTQYDEPLSDTLGPYPTHVKVNALAADEWNELVYLPKAVMEQARSLDQYALVLKTTFLGTSSSGAAFSTDASLLLLLPPAAFSKVAPSNGGVVTAANPSLHWNGSVGAIDYEYCFDTIDNNSCDTDWTGTYWLGTYGTDAVLQALPPGATFYWQVRANNMAGTTYANNGNWWSLQTRAPNTWTVANTNDSGPNSLRQAIADAISGDIIHFASELAGGSIMLDSALIIDKDLTIDASGLDPNVKIDGASSLDTLIGITQANDPFVILNHLNFLHASQYGIFQGGGVLDVRNSSFDGNGTGIQSETRLIITNSSFSNHEMDAIVNFGDLQITDSAFTANRRGIYNENVYYFSLPGKATITNSTFMQNYQGAIHNQNGTLTVTNSHFTSNQAENGGAIMNNGGATVTRSKFINNTATNGGGGISNGLNLIVRASTFSGNTAGSQGGGILSSGGLTLSGNTFDGNSAGSLGGALYIVEQSLVFNNTFTRNSAMMAGGIYFDTNSEYSISTFTNNTIAGNTHGGLTIHSGALELFNNILADGDAGSNCYIDGAALISGDHNLIEADETWPNNCDEASLTDDPKLDSLADNVDFTQTMALLPGSPAIDAGSDSACPRRDQRGIRRPQGSHCDIGAYEYEEDTLPPAVLSSLPADPNPTSASSLAFDVKFSEAVTGVDAADFALVTANLTGTAITEVNGSDADYTVTVNTGSVGQVDGTIRLNVVDNDSILDAVGNPLGGSGAGNGGFTATDFYTIAAQVAKPILLFPPRNNYTTGDITPDFRWKSVTDASRYQIMLATDPDFNENMQEFPVNETSFTVETPLPGDTYYVRVQAYNILDQPGDWSTSRYFNIDTVPPLPPLLRFPAHDASVRGIPTFRWAPASSAVQYEFQLDNDANFSSPLFSVVQRLTHRRLPGGLRGTYYWRVRAQDAAGNWSDWSEVFTVNITRSR